MHWTWHWPLLCATYIHQALGLHESDVGVIDWHREFIGLPNSQAPLTLPSFHRVLDERDKTTSSVIITGTRRNVLAGLDPMNGTLKWRHAFAPQDPILSYRSQPLKDLVVSHSGPGGSEVRIFSALQGELICETPLHPPESGRLEEPQWLGTAISFGADADAFYVLSNGNTVTKLSNNCEKIWTWASPDDSRSILFTQLLATEDAIYLAGMNSVTASYTIYLVSISPKDGTTLQNVETSYVVDHPSTFSFLSYSPDKSKKPNHALVLLENSKIKYFTLDAKLIGRKKANKLADSFTHLVPLGQQYNGHIIARKEEGTAHVLRLWEDKSVTDAWVFSGSDYDSYTGSPPLFSAGIDRNGKIYVSRCIWSFNIDMGSMTVYSEGEDGRGMEHGISFPFSPADQGVMLHIALDASNPHPMMVSARYVISTSLGGFQLWDREYLKWTREEGLSEIVEDGVQFIDLPFKQKEAYIAEGIIHRLRRQSADIKNLPSYLLNFIRRFATGNYNVIPTASGSGSSTTELYRDVFGFHKVILTASASGKVYALDSVTGKVIYSRVLSLGGSPGATFRIIKLLTLRGVADSGDLPPEAALVVTRISEIGAATLLYTFEALTGKPTRGAEIEGALEGTVVFEGIARDAHALTFEKVKLILVIGDDDKVHLHPQNALTETALAEIQTDIHAPYLNSNLTSGRLIGHRLSRSRHSSQFSFEPTWTHSLPHSYHITSIFKPPADQPIASFGKTLANRTTLYKYLNPSLVGVVSSTPSNLAVEAGCMLQIVDGVTGRRIYEVHIPVSGKKGEEGCNVKAALVENWLVYHYWDYGSESSGGAAGWRIGSVEFYEGKGANERHRSSELSSYSRDNIPITIFDRTFVFLKDITTMEFTSTANGISVKDLIVSTPSGQIQTIPRRLLDPRRPSSKPSSKEIEEEWLIQYDPLLSDDSRRIITHRYPLLSSHPSVLSGANAAIRNIRTSPTSLESTSLVFGFGLDLFGSRVSPSGRFDLLSEGFNKVQLVLTITALVVGVVITRPMVKRKKLREKWYSSSY